MPAPVHVRRAECTPVVPGAYPGARRAAGTDCPVRSLPDVLQPDRDVAADCGLSAQLISTTSDQAGPKAQDLRLETRIMAAIFCSLFWSSCMEIKVNFLDNL